MYYNAWILMMNLQNFPGDTPGPPTREGDPPQTPPPRHFAPRSGPSAPPLSNRPPQLQILATPLTKQTIPCRDATGKINHLQCVAYECKIMMNRMKIMWWNNNIKVITGSPLYDIYFFI